MKKWLIGSLVGAIILFLWQFLSWGPANLHASAFTYTPQEEAIMQSLSANLQEDGQYMVPGYKPGTSHEDMEKMMKDRDGKPWAFIQYHKALKTDMVKPMIRGFLIDLVIVMLLIYIFSNVASAAFSTILINTLVVGFLTWLWGPYTSHNWMDMSMSVIKSDLLDIIVGWGLLGAWLGFWLKRN